MTYNMIASEFRKRHNRHIKSCWIADVKRELGMTTRVASNRISISDVKYPCPTKEIRDRIKSILLSGENKN